MNPSVKTILERVASWPTEDQDELTELAREIEARRSGADTAPAEPGADEDNPEAALNGATQLTRGEFARISEVEGLRLSDEMKRAFADFDRRKLSAEERRQAIIDRFKRVPR